MKAHKLIFERVVNDIQKEKPFTDFKFRKRDSALLNKFESGFEMVELQNWEGANPITKKASLVIKPLFLRRFDVIHEWFEKYSFKSLKDQKDNFSIGFDGAMLNNVVLFNFDLDGENYHSEFLKFKISSKENSDKVFKKYSDIDSLFDFFINPVLEGRSDLPMNGSDWFFKYLTITKISCNEKFNLVLDILHSHFKELYMKREPNVIEYYPKLDTIIEDLKNRKL